MRAEQPLSRILKLKTAAGQLLEGEVMLNDSPLPIPGTSIDRTSDQRRYRVLGDEGPSREGNRLLYVAIVERLDEEGSPR